MKKKLAFGIAGASALLVAGWRLAQAESETAASRPGAGFGPTGSSAPGGPPKPGDESPGDAPTRASSGADAISPNGVSKAELYEIAQELKIKGRSKMSKAELRQAIDSAS